MACNNTFEEGDVVNVDHLYVDTQDNNMDSTAKLNYGGFTCCVPLCYSNSKKHKHLKFYVIPKDKTLRDIWLSKISRKDFNPSSGHRVCSAHFKDGQNTYDNNIPTFVPKTITCTQPKERITKNSSRNTITCVEIGEIESLD